LGGGVAILLSLFNTSTNHPDHPTKHQQQDAGGKCDDAAAAGRAAYAAPFGAVKLFTNAPTSALLLKTTTRLTGVQYDEGAISAAEW
jgi:hypothetical protein